MGSLKTLSQQLFEIWSPKGYILYNQKWTLPTLSKFRPGPKISEQNPSIGGKEPFPIIKWVTQLNVALYQMDRFGKLGYGETSNY